MLGILGGMGPRATAQLYLGLTDRFARRGGHDLPPMLIHSVAMTRGIENAFLGGAVGPDSPELRDVRALLDDAVMRLVAGGVTHVIMPCNTLQDELARVCAAHGVVHIDMIDATADAIVDAGVERVLVLATTAACRTDIYGQRLRSHGICCVYPTQTQQSWLAEYIRGALDLQPQEQADGLRPLLSEFTEATDGIVIGCTDLSGAVRPGRDEMLFDSLECLVSAAMKVLMDPAVAQEPRARIAR